MKKMKDKEKVVHRGQNSTLYNEEVWEGKNGEKCSKDKQLESYLVESNLTERADM